MPTDSQPVEYHHLTANCHRWTAILPPNTSGCSCAYKKGKKQETQIKDRETARKLRLCPSIAATSRLMPACLCTFAGLALALLVPRSENIRSQQQINSHM